MVRLPGSESSFPAQPDLPSDTGVSYSCLLCSCEGQEQVPAGRSRTRYIVKGRKQDAGHRAVYEFTGAGNKSGRTPHSHTPTLPPSLPPSFLLSLPPSFLNGSWGGGMGFHWEMATLLPFTLCPLYYLIYSLGTSISAFKMVSFLKSK